MKMSAQKPEQNRLDEAVLNVIYQTKNTDTPMVRARISTQLTGQTSFHDTPCSRGLIRAQTDGKLHKTAFYLGQSSQNIRAEVNWAILPQISFCQHSGLAFLVLETDWTLHAKLSYF